MGKWTPAALPRCLLGYSSFMVDVGSVLRLHSTTSTIIFAFTCLEAEAFDQMVVRGLNISLSGNPSNENICSGETARQSDGR